MTLLGVDTGGTFTDFLLVDASGAMQLHKVLSTPQAPERAILQGIAELGIDMRAVRLVHGSTVATNAVLEGKGVRTAYITNRGFADVLAIGRQARAELYNLTPKKVPPLLAPDYCLEVDSRLAPDGAGAAVHLQRVTAPALAQLCQRLQQLKVEAVAINLLFSFLDDSEERAIAEAISQQFGEAVFISRGSDVLPVEKEYERGIAATLNAMVGPLLQGYLARLQHALPDTRIDVMQSSGTTASVTHAGRYPVQLLLSGPAGGLRGAHFVAGCAGAERLLTFDMGGTSTDVSIINGAIGFTPGARIAGHPVAVPMVDLHTIGAGGGSIARVDAGGLLLVGPQSAGAVPGPACYAQGGTQATVTDANVVLGRLLPDAFLGGRMVLDEARAQRAVAGIADQLGMGVEQAAQGIIDVVNDHMVRALRLMSVQRGENPKHYTRVSYGGAGGLHVCALAAALGMQRAIVPVYAGVLSALGMLVAEPGRERVRSCNRWLRECDAQALQNLFAELTAQAEAQLVQAEQAAGVAMGALTPRYQCSVDLRYCGQSNALNLPWRDLPQLAPAFHVAHQAVYGHRLALDIELVNLRVRVSVPQQALRLPAWRATTVARVRHVQLAGGEPVPVLARTSLSSGQRIDGPAIIIESSATTWLQAGWTASVDDIGNLLLTSCAVAH
jgi:N-methylhydantoinase A